MKVFNIPVLTLFLILFHFCLIVKCKEDIEEIIEAINHDTKRELKPENSCRVQEDCEELNNCINGHCKHKEFFPITAKEATGAILIIIGSALSNAGGTGGGGLLVPILIIYLNFYTKEAIPISKLMIFTGALTAFLMGLKNKNPFRNATAIDYSIAIIIIPLVLFGTMIGVTLNKIFPPWMILVCLTLILIINTIKTTRKGLEIYSKEQLSLKSPVRNRIKMKEIKKTSTINGDEDEEEDVLMNEQEQDQEHDSDEKVEAGTNLNLNEFNSITRKTLLNIELEKDKSLFPLNKIIFVLISYTILIMITLLKGSDHVKSIVGIQKCSFLYWAVFLSYLPISIVITYIVGKIVYEEYNYRLEIGYPYHPSDIKFTKELIIKYPIYALSAGVLSGLLGIGGGLILGPLLLDLGIHPLISTATSNFLVVFISSSTTLQYIMLGMMNFHYGFVCTILSTVGSCIGTYIIQKYLERTKRHSVLVFVLAFVLGASTLFIPAHTLMQITKQLKDEVNIWEFHSPC